MAKVTGCTSGTMRETGVHPWNAGAALARRLRVCSLANEPVAGRYDVMRVRSRLMPPRCT
jgi:hypothetical protein